MATKRDVLKRVTELERIIAETAVDVAKTRTRDPIEQRRMAEILYAEWSRSCLAIRTSLALLEAPPALLIRHDGKIEFLPAS